MVACHKRCDEPRTNSAGLDIIEAGIFDHMNAGRSIPVMVRYVLPISCYCFVRFDIRNQQNGFEKWAQGSYRSQGACTDLLYRRDSAFHLGVPAAGQYVVRFYSRDSLFQTDSVQVS